MLMSILSQTKKKECVCDHRNSLNAGFETIEFLGRYVMRQLKKWTTIVVPGTGVSLRSAPHPQQTLGLF